MILAGMMLLASAWDVSDWRPAPLSSAAFESHPAFDRRGSALYFVRSRPNFSGWRLQIITCRGGRWSEPQAPSFAGDGAEADPFITRDGGALYFISSRSEAGVRQRELDIWRVTRQRGGTGGLRRGCRSRSIRTATNGFRG